MSLDLVAVQRDAALLDDLAQRVPIDTVTGDQVVDPVVGLLAAFVASVDDGLADVADRPAAPGLVPVQSRRNTRAAAASSLPVVLTAVGRRHVVGAVAALVVTVAVLSVSGVAAAVSGDPLRPYKIVVDVVRGHGDAVPKSLPAATRGAGQSRAAADARSSQVAAERGADAPRASRSSDRRDFWDRRDWDRAGWRGGSVGDGWVRNGWRREGRDDHRWDGRQRSGGQPGWDQRSGYGDRRGANGPAGDDTRSRDDGSAGSGTWLDSGGHQHG